MKKEQVHQIKTDTNRGRKIPFRFAAKVRSVIPTKEAFPPIQRVQGILPDSKEEWWIALAHYKLRLEFIFQRQALANKGIRGSQTVDFWTLTVPLPTPIYIQGAHWHNTPQTRWDSKLKIAQLKKAYPNSIMEPIEIFDFEIPTPDMAYQVLKQKLRM